MLKIRYFSLRFDASNFGLSNIYDLACRVVDSRLTLVSGSGRDMHLLYQSTRLVRTLSILDDGSELTQEYPTIDRYRIRLFEGREGAIFLSVIDPPRSSRVITEAMELLMPGTRVYFEPLVFGAQLVEQHTSQFDVAKLVSAKIKNFKVYDNAVGRLEVSSRTGLLPNIAPFVEGKYFEIESLSYEVISDLTKGLIAYSTNGTVRVSGQIVEAALARLEACF